MSGVIQRLEYIDRIYFEATIADRESKADALIEMAEDLYRLAHNLRRGQ